MSKNKPVILVVDDDRSSLDAMCETLRRTGYEVVPAHSGAEAFQYISNNEVDLVLTDLFMPTINGMEIMNAARRNDPNIAVIIFTGHGTIENAVEAMKAGAFHYLTKPVNIEELRLTVKKALERKNLISENIDLKRKIERKFGFENIIANSRKMQDILDTVVQIAPTRANVLITGESGTGKELIANAIHYNSNRKNEPIIKLNCAVLAEGVLESELFGHEKGSFTGAIKSRKGMFEMADGGTLFLDEIGDIPLSTQVKLLRVIEEREFTRVGGTESIKVDVRLIAATNRDLKKAIKEGSFREDLYFRLNVVSIEIPPLRERREDIPFMVQRFMDEFCKENAKPSMLIKKDTLEALQKYSWPGNVRELRNAIESLVVRLKEPQITLDDLPSHIRQNEDNPAPAITVGLSINEMEKELIAKTLESVKGNKTQAAKILGIGLRTLYRKMTEYQMDN
jgi:two-component system response regulator HydG